jgi:Peptidase A4 family
MQASNKYGGATMGRIVLVLIGGIALVLPVAPASSFGTAGLRPNSLTTMPSGGVNATIDWASRNWSGYADTGDAPYDDVTGEWTVPAVTDCNKKGKTPACYSAAWIGIDGFDNNSLIQTGTEQDLIDGEASYSAWWTTSAEGFAEQPITTDCSPSTNCGIVDTGDSITAEIEVTNSSTNQWTINISDTDQGWTFTHVVTYAGPGDSAEWIMEVPRLFPGSIATMPEYATFDFHPVSANTVDPLADALGGVLIQKGKVVSIPSDVDSDDDGFAMAYGPIAPSAPSP